MNDIINSIETILKSNINITFFKDKIQIFKQFSINLNYFILNNEDNIFNYVSNNRFYICCKINNNINKKILLFFKNNLSIDDFKDDFRQFKNINEFNDEFNIYNLFKDKLLNEEDIDNENLLFLSYYDNDKLIINFKLLYLCMFSIILLSINPLFSFCNNSYIFSKDRIKKNLSNPYNDVVIIMKINILNENLRLKYFLKEYNDISNYNESNINELIYNNKLYKSYYSLRINDASYDFTLNSKYDIDYKIHFINVLVNYFFFIF